MSNYLDTIYFRNETSTKAYPQLLCNYLFAKYKLKRGENLLDIGSGKGNHLRGFYRCGINVHGIDLREECVNASMGTIPVQIQQCDIENESIPFDRDTFDIIFSKSVLEHVLNADNFLKQAYRVLKPCGRVILMTPDWDSNHRWFWDDYTHVKAWTRKSLQNAMRMHGFRNVKCTYFRQLPILWKYPWIKPLCDAVSLLPASLKWKDKKEEQHRKFIRFSMEKMLLATGLK